MAVLLTGGTGFIGSHTAVELLTAGHDVVLLDDLSNSDFSVVVRIQALTGKRVSFYRANAADRNAMERAFDENTIDTVIHFAGFKAVGESVRMPLAYYRNNLDTTLTLLETMRAHGCKRLIFSSSAIVYGLSEDAPFTEETAVRGCTNPYGWTKYMIEQILRDAVKADPALSVVMLRYFNPVGAHPSGLLGERPQGTPNNLMPYVTLVAAGVLPKLSVYGGDYPTPDGTGVRDYIHVVDLARSHVAAMEYSAAHCGCEVFNIGTGVGYSVLDVVHAFEKANGVRVPFEIVGRRRGDVACCYAATDKARRLLGWQAERELADMCRDAWRWQQTERKPLTGNRHSDFAALTRGEKAVISAL